MLASSCGLATGLYYLASPLTFRRVRLPYQPCDYRLDADPAVVIAFEDDNDDDGSSRGFRHYHLVVAYQVHDGVWKDGFVPFIAVEETVKPKVTKKAPASASKSNKRKKTKDLSESEEEDDDEAEDESEDDEDGDARGAKGKRGRKPSRRGTGSGVIVLCKSGRCIM
ncbi:hypothetical protein ZWY2020_058422 [Hordeum vulgare]|nr:hypothetical protein ZWY2020_058422 [Hordeum vulgare]